MILKDVKIKVKDCSINTCDFVVWNGGLKDFINGFKIAYTTPVEHSSYDRIEYIPCNFKNAYFAKYQLPRLLDFINTKLFLDESINTLYNEYLKVMQEYEDEYAKYDKGESSDEMLEHLTNLLADARSNYNLAVKNILEPKFSDIYRDIYSIFPVTNPVLLTDLTDRLFIYNDGVTDYLCEKTSTGEYECISHNCPFALILNSKQEDTLDNITVLPCNMFRTEKTLED